MIQKQPINIPFAQGLDTKTDPNQIPVGKFLQLSNSVFDKGGRLQKRNGYSQITSLPDTTSTSITTYNGNLVATGLSLYSYSPDTMTWLNKGNLNPVNLSVKPLLRNSAFQRTVDVAVSPNQLICTTWQESDGNSYYQIVDGNDGNVLISKTALEANSKISRTFTLGNYFVITYLITITGTTHLRYISIPIVNVFIPSSPTDISTQVFSDSTGYDGQLIDGQLYLAWNGSDGGGAVRVSYIDSVLNQHITIVMTGRTAVKVSVCGDTSQSSNIVWVSFIETSGDAYSAAFTTQLATVLAPTMILPIGSYQNLTSTAINMVLTVYYEVNGTYSYSSVKTDHVSKQTITQTGTVGTPSVVLRSVGLSSKAFIYNSNTYLLVTYGGAFQPTYFLINSSGETIGKLAYANGGGYEFNQILSNSLLIGDTVNIGYLFKDQLVPVNKTQNVDSTGGVFGQTGINMASFTFASKSQSLEIGSALHINGGFLRMYDGVKPVEHNFFLWPEDLAVTPMTLGGGLSPQQYFYQAIYAWTDAQGNIHRSAPSIALESDLTAVVGTPVTFTAAFSTGDTTITVSSTTGLHVGQIITDTSTPGSLSPNTRITSISGLNVGISLATLGTSTTDTLQTVDVLSNTVNVPTLRITYKTGVNPLRIEIYRWSASQQNYFLVTSISNPIINSTTVDSITFTDTLSDQEIIGNPLIYTTGGVIENIAAPACNAMTLFQSRLFLIDAEDPNSIWFSKQVIEDTPVEMSDLFTKYIAPTIGATVSTGDAKALFQMDDKLIVFKKDTPYYMTGVGPDNTGTNDDFSQFTFITSSVGCENQDSLSFQPSGIMFQSDKGRWLLGRDLSTTYIGAPVEDFNLATDLSALSIPGTNQIRITLSSGVTLMYDYYFQQWGTFQGIPGISSTIYNGLHTFLNSLGQVFQESPGVYLDGSTPVVISFLTGWFSLAGLQGFERAYFFYLLGNYITPHILQLQIAYDYDPSLLQSSTIQPINFSPPWGGDPLYGSSSPWGGPSNVEQWRIFLQKQKCESFQIKLNEFYDASFGVPAGAGFTLSGINLLVGVKGAYPRLAPNLSVG